MNAIEPNYRITQDAVALDYKNVDIDEVARKSEYYYYRVQKGKKSDIKVLLEEIKKYPTIPQYKNYLSVLYSVRGEFKKAEEINERIIREHPDYLYGLLNKANSCIDKEQYDKIPALLGEAFDLKALYPNREVFHVAEVVNYHITVATYFAGIDDFEQAKAHSDYLKTIDPEIPIIAHIDELYGMKQFQDYVENFIEHKDKQIKVVSKSPDLKTIPKPSAFTHPEIEWLYSFGFNIDEDKLHTILALPRESLIKDLESVLLDSIHRFEYYHNFYKETDDTSERLFFAIHAVFLLGELEATESLQTIFWVLSQSEKYNDIFFGDLLTEELWDPFYKMAHNKLDECKAFIFKPGITTESRCVVFHVLAQIALNQAHRRDEVIEWYNDVIQFFVQSKPEDNVIDNTASALMVNYLINIKGLELLPEIKKLYESEYIDDFDCGTFDEVSTEMLDGTPLAPPFKLYSITERYRDLGTTWESYPDEDADNYDDNKATELEKLATEWGKVVAAEEQKPKVGRNDPCPCGSGKKYKKCCLNK